MPGFRPQNASASVGWRYTSRDLASARAPVAGDGLLDGLGILLVDRGKADGGDGGERAERNAGGKFPEFHGGSLSIRFAGQESYKKKRGRNLSPTV